MTSISYTHVRNNLASVMKEANDNREPVIITRNGHQPVVMLAMDEYESMEATLHLLSSPANRERIQKGLQDYEKDKGVSHELIED